MPADRPNILWIINHDVSAENLGCYGETQTPTPRIDALAAAGRRFDRAFTTCPVCSPARSAVWTGMAAPGIGAHHHRSHRDDGYTLPDGVATLSQRLRDAGYHTALVSGGELGDAAVLDLNFETGRLFDSHTVEEADGRPSIACAQIGYPHRMRGRPGPPPHPVDPDTVELPAFYPDHPVARADWADYLGRIQFLDAEVGRWLDWLDGTGQADDTVVVYLADHGRPMPRGKQFCYDAGLRVPMVIRPRRGDAEGVGAGVVDGRLVSTIDVHATTLAFAGVDRPSAMHGRVLLGDAKGADRDAVFAGRDRCDGTVDRIRAVRTGGWKYIRNFMPQRPYTQFNAYKEEHYPALSLMRQLRGTDALHPAAEAFTDPGPRPAEELYDLHADPDELVNLAGRPEHADTLAAMRARLEAWGERVGDRGREPEPDAVVEAQWQKMAGQWRRATGREPPAPGGCLPAAVD